MSEEDSDVMAVPPQRVIIHDVVLWEAVTKDEADYT
jgi:hypothetical protein